MSKLRHNFLSGCDRILPILELLATNYPNNLPEANLTLKSVLSKVCKLHPQLLLKSCYLDLFLSTPASDKFAK